MYHFPVKKAFVPNRQQPTLGMVAEQATFRWRPWRPLGGPADYPPLADFVGCKVLHQSDVLFWVGGTWVSCVLNGLPMPLFKQLARFAGLSIETQVRPQDLAPVGMLVSGRANVLNYTSQIVLPMTPLVMGVGEMNARNYSVHYQGTDASRIVPCLKPAFELASLASDRFEPSFAALPVTEELAYVSMKIRNSPQLSAVGLPTAGMAPVNKYCYSGWHETKDPDYVEFVFDRSERSRLVVKNLFFFETVMEFLKRGAEGDIDRVRQVVREHVVLNRLPRLAVHLDVGIHRLQGDKRHFLRPIDNLYAIIGCCVYVSMPGERMTVIIGK